MTDFNSLLVTVIIILQMVIIISTDQRIVLFGLFIQYVIVFQFISQQWLPGPAMIKLVSGIMTTIILGLSIRDFGSRERSSYASLLRDHIFKGLISLFVMITVFSLAPRLSTWIQGLPESLMITSVMLLVFGILQLSLTDRAFKIIVGLLTMISGFEILFSALETSLLLTGLIAGIHLSLGLLGSYLVQRSDVGEYMV